MLERRLATDLDAAFPELVHELQDGVYSGIRRLAGGEAADLAQETFLRAYRALSQMEPERIRDLQLRGWVWTIALNLCRNEARRRKRKPTVGLSAEWEPPEPGPAEAVVDGVAWDARLAALPAAQRTAVVLRHVAGLSYDEIAVATGRASGTAKADVHRGLKRLRTILAEEEA